MFRPRKASGLPLHGPVAARGGGGGTPRAQHGRRVTVGTTCRGWGGGGWRSVGPGQSTPAAQLCQCQSPPFRVQHTGSRFQRPRYNRYYSYHTTTTTPASAASVSSSTTATATTTTSACNHHHPSSLPPLSPLPSFSLSLSLSLSHRHTQWSGILFKIKIAAALNGKKKRDRTTDQCEARGRRGGRADTDSD